MAEMLMVLMMIMIVIDNNAPINVVLIVTSLHSKYEYIYQDTTRSKR
jgi:hypothetical protein